MHIVSHLDKCSVIHYINFEFGVETKWIVRVLISAKLVGTKLWHELGTVMIDVHVSLEEKIVKFVSDVVVTTFAHFLKEGVAISEFVVFVGLVLIIFAWEIESKSVLFVIFFAHF